MFRRLPLILLAGPCLLLASGAAAAELNAFTAASTPLQVKPGSTALYTITLTNDALSPERGQTARIGIPPGFVVNPATVQATTDPVGGCDGSPWEPDGTLIVDSTIQLKRPGGNATGLCPGAKLTVSFAATSASIEDTFTWTTRLIVNETDFALVGPDPTVVVDGTAPDTAIGSGPPTPTNQTIASFAFSSSEPASTFSCSIDGAAFAECASPKEYSGLAAGAHSFRVRAIDAAGNTDASPAVHGWTIDLLAPVTLITAKPSNPSNSGSASFAFTVNEPASTACSLDGAAFVPCVSPASYENLTDGPHTFALRTTDSAGNTGPEASYNWTIETRPPTAGVTSGPTGLTNSRSATFGFLADEPSTFECRLDDRGFEPCGSPVTYQGLPDGVHAFVVRPTDGAGNAGTAATRSWSIDATAPETRLGSRPRSGTTVLSATFTFSASEAAAFECRLDAMAFVACSSPSAYVRLARTGHTFQVRAIDLAGNVDSTPAIHRWTISAAPRRAKTASALLTPPAGARVTSAPLLVWRRVARASYYNVQLYRGRVKVLSSWPTTHRLRLRMRWTYLGRQRRLSPGSYRWYVWPGYGRASANRYGPVLGQSTFTVAAPGRR
jgi:hypothetical protein